MKGKTLVYTLLTAAALAVITLVGTPRTYAAGYDMYPGAMCIKWTGTAIPKYFYGSIGNTSPTDWLYLDCPVVTPTSGEPIDSGEVDVRDLNPNSGVTCTLYSTWNAYSDGAYYFKTGGTKTSGGSGYSPQPLAFSGVGFNVDGSTYSVTYYSCAIPPSYSGGNSYIIDYDVFNWD